MRKSINKQYLRIKLSDRFRWNFSPITHKIIIDLCATQTKNDCVAYLTNVLKLLNILLNEASLNATSY